MMKAIAVVALAVALVAAGSTLPTVSIDKYSDKKCSGTAEKHWTLPTETCVATNETDQKDVKAIRLECFQAWGAEKMGPVRAGASTCAQIEPSPNKTCDKTEGKFAMQCNQCMREEYGYHKFDCNTAANKVVVYADCEEGCNTCKQNHTITVGECVHFVVHRDNKDFERNFKFDGFGSCPSMVMEEMFRESTCKGFPDHFYHFESGKCVDGYKFDCSGDDPRPTRGPEPTHHAVAHRHLRSAEDVTKEFLSAYQKKDVKGMRRCAMELQHLKIKAVATNSTFNPWDWIKCEVCKKLISKIVGIVVDYGCDAADPLIDAACAVAPPGFDVACAVAFDAACELIAKLVIQDHTPVNSHLCNDIHMC